MHQIQNRIQSMTMIHQNLYQGKNLGSIEMKNYFKILGDFCIAILWSRAKNSYGL